jgi:serine/threonine protein kinase
LFFAQFLSAQVLVSLIPFPVKKNQETGQLEYLIPEKSSLKHHLQCPDKKFVDFISYLLQINPKKRPTAIEALQHRWLSVVYS